MPHKSSFRTATALLSLALVVLALPVRIHLLLVSCLPCSYVWYPLTSIQSTIIIRSVTCICVYISNHWCILGLGEKFGKKLRDSLALQRPKGPSRAWPLFGGFTVHITQYFYGNIIFNPQCTCIWVIVLIS